MVEASLKPIIDINSGKDITLILASEGQETEIRAVTDSVHGELLIVRTPTLNGELFAELADTVRIRYADIYGVVHEQKCAYHKGAMNGAVHYTILSLHPYKVLYTEQRRNDFRLAHTQTVGLDYKYRDESTLKMCSIQASAMMHDISCGGMCILTNMVFKRDELVTLTFNGLEPLELDARVVHIWERRSKVNPYRVGLKFVITDSALRQKIHRYVMDLQIYYLKKRTHR